MFDNIISSIKQKLNPVSTVVKNDINSAISSASKVFPSVGNFVQKQYNNWQQQESNKMAQKALNFAVTQAPKIPQMIDSGLNTGTKYLGNQLSKVNIPISTPLLPGKKYDIPVGKFVSDNFLNNPETSRAFPASPIYSIADAGNDPAKQQKAALDMVMALGINAPQAKAPNLVENVAPKVETNFMKVKGSKQPDFIAGAEGVSPVKTITSKKLTDLFKPKTEVLPNTGLQLPSGEVPKPKLQLPEGTNPAKEAINVGETSWWSQKTLEPKRFFKKVLPEKLQSVADETIFKPLNQLRGKAAQMKNAYDSQIKNLGNEFKVGSEYSKLTQQYGEGIITKDQLVAKLGPEGATKVENAKNFFRQAYDDLLKTINTNRTAAGMDIINPRPDYFRHMAELGTDENSLSRILNGGSGSTGIKSKGIFKQRKGDQTEYDAVGGFINYLDRASRAAYTDTIAPTVKNLAKKLEAGGAPSQTIQYLNNYADQILGISHGEGAVVNTLNKVASKMRGSQVLGNVSSLVNQSASLPIAINDAGWGNYLKGFTSKEAGAAAKTSPYLLDRSQRMSTSLLTGFNKIKGQMGAVLQDADVAATKSMWRAFYEKAKSSGAQDAVQYADDAVESIVGTRGVGGFSEWQQSKLGQLLAPFTSEAQTAGNKIIELIGQKKAGTLLGIIATNYLFNTASEKVTGQRPTFDPIQAGIDAYRLANGDDKTPQNKLQAAARIATETLQLSPIAQSLVSNTYALGQSAGVLPDSRTIFGSEDPTRMNVGSLYNPLSNVMSNGKFAPRAITGVPAIDAVLGIGAKFVPGGNQAIKTASGIRSNITGVAESRKGQVMFETPKDIVGQTQSAIFGPWSTKQAQEYFSNQFNRPMTPEETTAYNSLNPEMKTQFMQGIQAGNQAENMIKSQINEDGTYKGGKANPNLTSTNPKVIAAEKKRIDSIMSTGITPSDLDIEFKYFKDLPKNVKGTTSRLNAVVKAYEDTSLTPEQKSAILRVSKVDPVELGYYQAASLDNSERQQLLSRMADREDRKSVIITLLQQKRVVGNKALMGSTDVTYLYDQGLISKEEKEVLNAINYDESTGKYYLKRSVKDSISKSASAKATKAAKAKATLVKKSLSSVMSVKPPKIPTIDLTSLPRSTNTSKTKWFR